MSIILRYFPLVFMVCVAGCQTSTYDIPPADAHTTVKRTLPEVTNAILFSFRRDLSGTHKDERYKVIMTTNDIPGISYTLTEYEGGGWGSRTTTTICTTAVNSNEASIAVRCATVGGGCLPPWPVTRHRGVERRTLAAIIKTLNKKQ